MALDLPAAPENEPGANPWLRIPAGDYEGHMGPAGADQLAALSAIFAAAYAAARPARVAVLGCAIGNGFAHVDPRTSRLLAALDINRDYLRVARSRSPQLGQVIQPVCARVEAAPFASGSFDLISAALIFEYVADSRGADHRGTVQRVAQEIAAWLAPGGVLSVVLQKPSHEHGLVSPTPYASLQALEGVMHLVAPADLMAWLTAAGLRSISCEEVPLRFGKSFFAAQLRREC